MLVCTGDDKLYVYHEGEHLSYNKLRFQCYIYIKSIFILHKYNTTWAATWENPVESVSVRDEKSRDKTNITFLVIVIYPFMKLNLETLRSTSVARLKIFPKRVT